jgi:hypothetical protein
MAETRSAGHTAVSATVAETQLAFTDIAQKADRIVIDFALEAKCEQIENGVGVKELPG